MSARLPASLLCAAVMCSCQADFSTVRKASTPVDRTPVFRREHAGTVLPPNIAPLNFMVAEQGSRYRVEISSENGRSLTIDNSGPSIRIPLKPWKKLLGKNRGRQLRTTVYVRDSGGRWLRFKPVEDTIAAEPIDRCVTYRCLSFLYNYSTDLRIYERDLESYRESQLMNTRNFDWGCCNCHSPKNNDPRSFLVHIRSENYGSTMLLSQNGSIGKIDSRLGYPAWHPAGNPIVFSVYKVQQCFHAVGANVIDVYDNNSDLVVYDVQQRKTYAVPQLFQKQALETWPNWTPDGRHLYFCSSPILWDDFRKTPPDNFEKVRYSLLRISYNAAENSWGTVDTVLSPRQTGLSVSQPRISPDGRFLLFCMHRYGGYPHTQKSSDLYLMELASGTYRRLTINSDYAEMWHGWSSNGRWILFSSKRNGGIFTRLYFSYIDSSGTAHAPFIMPQKDPAYYDSFTKSYNVPEFATGPVPFTERDLLKALRSPAEAAVELPAASGASPSGPTAWEKLRTK
jgi:hypothetical protein